MSTIISKLFQHLKNGTLIDRLKKRKTVRYHKDWQKFLKSGDEAIVKEYEQGVKLKLYKDAGLSETLYCYDFEVDEVGFIYRFLKKGDVFFDVGANVGIFTVHGAKIVGESGHVHSFEPAKITYDRLVENVLLNNQKNVKSNYVAISDRVGFQEFYISEEGNDAFNSIVKPAKGDQFKIEKVPVITINDYVKQNELIGKIALMKIDVEGWEIPLLRGGEEILSREDAPVLIVEFTESNAISAGHSCAELYDLLVSFGYKMYLYDHATSQLKAESKREKYDHYLNLICIKNIAEVGRKGPFTF